MQGRIPIIASLVASLAAGYTAAARAQDPASRAEAIEQAEQAKADHLEPAAAGKAEAYVARLGDTFLANPDGLHSFWVNAYSGGGFTVGAGYLLHVSPYNTLDVRGSITPSGYKRVEAEFIAPELLKRHAWLSVMGGWREATAVNFYGFGPDSKPESLTNYGFTQPYFNTSLEVFPARELFVVRAGFELSQWRQGPGSGDSPSIETVYPPSVVPGLGAQPVYLHTQVTIGVDSRTARGYTRRGAFYGVTLHDYADTSKAFGFQEVDYTAIQHVPILREAWVLAFRAQAQTTYQKGSQQIPFFMMPSFSGGSDLRAYSSWRLKDLNSLLLQGEWRSNVNRFLEMALFYDAGTVAHTPGALSLESMKSDYGIGFRFHGRLATPLRIELAKGNEGLVLNFSASQVF